MEEQKIIQDVEAVEEMEAAPTADAGEADGPKKVSTIEISVLDNGGLTLDVTEGEKLEENDLENVIRVVYEQLRESRITSQALDAIKQRFTQ